ncbi:MAG: hypothetical protein ACK40M_04870 [Flavobacteriales bacterium]
MNKDIELSFERIRSIQFEQISYLVIHREFFKDLLLDPGMINRNDGIYTLRILSERNSILILSILLGNNEHFNLDQLINKARTHNQGFNLSDNLSKKRKELIRKFSSLNILKIRNQHIAHIDDNRIKIDLPYTDIIDLINILEEFFYDFNLEFDGLLFSSFLNPNSLKTLRINFDKIWEI